MFYAGITKLMNPNWSAAGYLGNAKMLPDFYAWLTTPAVLPIINFVNEWALTLLGVSLILGVFVRLSSVLGSLLMLLYYLPILDFPYPNAHAYIVDEHIIYILVLLSFSALKAGRVFGLDRAVSRSRFMSRHPRILGWLS